MATSGDYFLYATSLFHSAAICRSIMVNVSDDNTVCRKLKSMFLTI